jgi:MscS family membrane protein
LLVLLSVMLFRLLEELVAPSALTRLYVGRALLLVVVGSFAWGLINVLDYLIVRLDRALNYRQRVVSRSVIYLGRRTLKTVIAIFAAILILDNWGFNMTTIIAGLGVGGIAIALAAQQTIANVFGGVSVISDAPVMVGDFGSFGGVIGTVEDIGLRSVRVRTSSRTMVSIPNSAFAGMNLENYSVRDKILFNPSLSVKRAASKDQVRHLMQSLHQMLQENKQVEIGPAPIRISGYNAASYVIEVFSYVLTTDIDEYYKYQAELFLAIDGVVVASGVELA